MSEPTLTDLELRQIAEHASADWPREACGFVLHRGERSVVARARNIMDALHEKAPAKYPRPATHAYAVDPESMAALALRLRDGWVLHAIYHSHTQHEGANFSDDDVRWALHGQPAPRYPEAAQVVISVGDFGPTTARAFRWDVVRAAFICAGVAVCARRLDPAVAGGVRVEWTQPRVLPLAAALP